MSLHQGNDTLSPELPQVGMEALLPSPGRLPLSVLAGIGERLAAAASTLQRAAADPGAELARLERWGLQLQSLAQICTRAPQLRHEPVDLGLAVLQTLAEWSSEADRNGVELHGPACSVAVTASPAALKHLLDLMVEHGLQQGRAVRLDIVAEPDAAFAQVVVMVDCAPATLSPQRDTLAWQLLQLLARSLNLAPERQPVAGGERLRLSLPRA
jgi:hypothetical protein